VDIIFTSSKLTAGFLPCSIGIILTTDQGEYSLTFPRDSVSMKLPRLRFDLVERVRDGALLVRSPPRRPPRQKEMVARKKQATEAHANAIRYLPI
jgi:hypothetical protein